MEKMFEDVRKCDNLLIDFKCQHWGWKQCEWMYSLDSQMFVNHLWELLPYLKVYFLICPFLLQLDNVRQTIIFFCQIHCKTLKVFVTCVVDKSSHCWNRLETANFKSQWRVGGDRILITFSSFHFDKGLNKSLVSLSGAQFPLLSDLAVLWGSYCFERSCRKISLGEPTLYDYRGDSFSHV